MSDAAMHMEPQSYTIAARTLHWLTAALVLMQVPLGVVVAQEWGGVAQDWFYDLHKSIGVLLIPIVLLRIAYRCTYTPPPLPQDIPAIQQFAAHATHYALYALILVQPFIGWVATSAYPAPVPFFGLFDLPSIAPENRALSDWLFALHRVIGLVIGVIAAMHIGAALFHHFVRKDNVLMRMISG